MSKKVKKYVKKEGRDIARDGFEAPDVDDLKDALEDADSSPAAR